MQTASHERGPPPSRTLPRISFCNDVPRSLMQMHRGCHAGSGAHGFDPLEALQLDCRGRDGATDERVIRRITRISQRTRVGKGITHPSREEVERAASAILSACRCHYATSCFAREQPNGSRR